MGGESTMTQKGQVTIPQAIRKRLGLRPRDRVEFAVVGDNVVIRPARTRLLDGYGAVAPRTRPEDFRAAREAFERGVGDEAAQTG